MRLLSLKRHLVLLALAAGAVGFFLVIAVLITHLADVGISTWSTYANTPGRYSVQFPSGWVVVREKGENQLLMEEITKLFPKENYSSEYEFPSFISISVQKNVSDLPLDQFILTHHFGGKDAGDHLRLKRIVVGGVDALRTTDLPRAVSTDEVFVKRDSLIYNISSYTGVRTKRIDPSVYDRILSTFVVH